MEYIRLFGCAFSGFFVAVNWSENSIFESIFSIAYTVRSAANGSSGRIFVLIDSFSKDQFSAL